MAKIGKPTVLRIGIYFLAWLAMAIPVAFGIFLNSHTAVTVASHDAVIHPALGNHVTIRTGPFLPDVRRETGAPLGVDIVLGKTEAATIEEAVQRYGFIASQPDAQIAIVTGALKRMAIDASVRGGLVAMVPIGVWLLMGRQRRVQLFGATRLRRAVTAGLVVVVGSALVGTLVQKPWQRDNLVVVKDSQWLTLDEYLPEVPIPPEARGIEIQGTLAASGTRRLVQSAIDTYQSSSTFYAEAVAAVKNLDLHEPAEDETVAILVSDRHDNIGMDPVARAVADKAGATVILDAGDDTSTGSSWEAFSLDSLDRAFEDFEKYAVSGNHDHGAFVRTYLDDLDWTVSTGETIDAGPIGPLASFDDPRSSGLGKWRDAIGMTVGEMSESIADEICDEGRVSTLLVHDVNMGKQALARGCVDLVAAGHLHVQTGPDLVEGSNGEIGYRYTNGTTGGAAYAIAVGSKLRRAADVTLITYREGRPVGIQVVTLQTNNHFQVGDYVELTYALPEGPPATDQPVIGEPPIVGEPDPAPPSPPATP